MENALIRKGLVIGIILMLSIICIVPTNASISTIERQIKNQTKQSLPENWLANVTLVWEDDRFIPKTTFEIPDPEDRNYSYPINGGIARVNFTVTCEAWSDFLNILPKMVYVVYGVWDEDADNKLILPRVIFLLVPPLGNDPIEKTKKTESMELTVSVNETKLLGIYFQVGTLLPIYKESTTFFIWAHFE